MLTVPPGVVSWPRFGLRHSALCSPVNTHKNVLILMCQNIEGPAEEAFFFFFPFPSTSGSYPSSINVDVLYICVSSKPRRRQTSFHSAFICSGWRNEALRAHADPQRPRSRFFFARRADAEIFGGSVLCPNRDEPTSLFKAAANAAKTFAPARFASSRLGCCFSFTGADARVSAGEMKS